MTDNRTTELLRKLLNECGVGYFTDDDERAYDEPARTTWDFVLCGYEMTVTATEFVDIEGKTYLEMDFHHAFTPEQAIAATLGEKPRDKTEERLLDACNRAARDYVTQLEELVRDWQALYEHPDYGDCVRLRKRMQALGIEVIDE